MAHRWDPIAPPVTGLVVPCRFGPEAVDGPTRKQARGPHWRITSPGLAVPAHVTDDLVEQRILEVYARAGTRAVVTGWAALRLHGGGFFDGLARDGHSRLAVTIAANGDRFASGHGAVVVEDRMPADEVVEIHGIRCTTVERALYDEMQRIGEVREMAVAVGATCAAQLTTVGRMKLYAATRRWYRDVRVVKHALEISVEGCRSPQEDRFRIIWELDAQWGRPLINRTVLDDRGRFVAVPDLLDPVRGVVGEYAGADHRDIDRHHADIEREAAIRAVGLEYVEVVARDLRDPHRVVARMEEAAARAGRGPQRWTVGSSSRPANWP